MNTTQKVLITVGIVLALALSVFALNKAGQTIVSKAEQTFGATPTLDGVDNPYTSIGGFRTYQSTKQITATSSVICSQLNPFNATSSIIAASLNITTGMSGATHAIYLSTSTSAYASSSPDLIDNATVAAGAQASFLWMPSASTTANANLLPINGSNGNQTLLLKAGEYLTWRIATSSASVFSSYYQGTCSAVIRKL